MAALTRASTHKRGIVPDDGGYLRMVQVIAHRGASRASNRRTPSPRSGTPARSVRRRSSSTCAGPPTACSSCTTTPCSPTAGRSPDTDAADLPPASATLDVALDACAGMCVNIEIKNEPGEPDFDPSEWVADETIAHLVARVEDARWLISSFRLETVDRCRQLAAAGPHRVAHRTPRRTASPRCSPARPRRAAPVGAGASTARADRGVPPAPASRSTPGPATTRDGCAS